MRTGDRVPVDALDGDGTRSLDLQADVVDLTPGERIDLAAAQAQETSGVDEDEKAALAVHVPQQRGAHERQDDQEQELEVAEGRRAVDPPEIVADDAVDDEEEAERELGEESASADAKESLGVAEFGHRSRQVFIVRQVHEPSGGKQCDWYNNRPRKMGGRWKAKHRNGAVAPRCPFVLRD